MAHIRKSSHSSPVMSSMMMLSLSLALSVVIFIAGLSMGYRFGQANFNPEAVRVVEGRDDRYPGVYGYLVRRERALEFARYLQRNNPDLRIRICPLPVHGEGTQDVWDTQTPEILPDRIGCQLVR